MVSVVVPVYNVEKWIERCLNSIRNQTYSDIEVIVVDDGSSDGGKTIAERIACDDRRFRVYSNTNHGVGYTRNFGISKAKGEYIAFVDSDDYISQDYIETLMRHFSDETDLVICGYNEIAYTERNHDKNIKEHVLDPDVCSNLTGDIYKDFYDIRGYINSPCLKLFRKSIMIDHHVRFPEDLITGEDLIFNLLYFQYMRKYVYVPYTGYQYFMNHMSVTHQGSMEHYVSSMKANMRRKKLLAGKDIPYRKKYEAELIYGSIQWFVDLDGDDTLKRYLRMMNKLETGRSFAVLDSAKATFILLLYKLHLLWIYYYIARYRRRKKKIQ